MIFEQLKLQTKQAHNEAEAYNDADKILKHTCTKAEYIEILQINYASYKPLEDVVVNHIDVLPEHVKPFATHQKSNRIVNDLELLNQNDAISYPETNFTTIDVPTLVGIMYVMEGSMMGGLLISKALLQCKALELPTQEFFNRNVQDTLAHWQNFKTEVEKISFTEEEIDIAVKAANNAFLYFKEAHLYRKEHIEA